MPEVIPTATQWPSQIFYILTKRQLYCTGVNELYSSNCCCPQVVYVLATVVGGLLSAFSSDSIGTEKGVSIAAAICGGMLLLIGARLAAGCTRYVGLSCVCVHGFAHILA